MEKSKILGLFFVLFGYILAVISVSIFGYSIPLKSFLLGIAAIIIALMIQLPLQLSVVYFRDKLKLGVVSVSILLGFSAGASQEFVKFLFVNGETLNFAVAFGMGIGLFEILYAIPVILYKDKLPEHLGGLVEKSPWLGTWERFFGTLFHVVTSAILTYGGISFLLLFIVLHGLIDSFATMHNLGKGKMALMIGEILLAIFSVALLLVSPIL